jgi:murein DD-endopeptidase MepM/ murein hydrolase activator NlpD
MPGQVRQLRRSRVAAALAATLATASIGIAQAQDLEGQLEDKEAALGEKREQKEILTTDISALSDEISQLEGELATLRTREATVKNELDALRAQLHAARERLTTLRARYHRSMGVLEDRLVAIYKQDEPDALTVILNADGFDDMLERYEYLNRIEDQDASIIARVRDLKEETKATVDEIETAKAEVAAKKRELARTRSQLEAREGELVAARAEKSEALDQVAGDIEHLEEGVEKLQDDIEAELQAAAEEQASTGGLPAEIPAGPVQNAGSGFIWPVNGPLTSPFGQRWGRLHAGIDIGAPDGTPIRAAKAGSIAMAQVYGGYGNYTCLNHGGGLSTCYAHQSGFEVTSGSVEQGDVIGYVGNTGNSFGAHLHFEVRVNGQPVDPMGYL